MRVCDRCQSPARDEVLFKLDDMKIDLCDQCAQALKEFASEQPKAKSGRKPKTNRSKT